tara:strand:+ start:5631 stop:6221 length:591 start_codon:yes stop_codon:yes gene_type:complete
MSEVLDSRAYSTLEIKSMDEDTGIITGIASTPATDRHHDIVLPEGGKFKLPIPFLWQHDHGDPIGEVIEASVSSKGIKIVARIALGVTEDIDRYWKLMKAGLVRGLSIGFKGLKVEPIDGTIGLKYLLWEWLELSAVTIPANAESNISSIKHYAEPPAASGTPATAPTEKKAHRVVKLSDPARVRAKPFVIKKIHR